MADPKPWEKESYDFTGGKKKKKKKPGLNEIDAAEQDTNYSDAFSIAQDRRKRQKKLAPYAKTGPGAPKK